MTTRGYISRAVAEALRDAPTLPQDAGAKALAKKYAAMIDEVPALLPDLGPKLLAALTALGCTPAGRGAKGGDQGGSPVASKLDEFTAARARKHSA